MPLDWVSIFDASEAGRADMPRTILVFLLAVTALLHGCGTSTRLAGYDGASWDDAGDDSEPNIRSGRLATDEVWRGTIVIDGEVLVPEGVTLTIQAGTRVSFAEGVEPSSKIIVEGSVYAQGDFQTPVYFAAEPQSAEWHGVLMEEGSVGRLAYAQLIGGKVHTRSASTQISYSQFSENAGAALTIEGSNPTVEDSLFRRNVVGIRVIRQGAPDIMNNTLIGNVYGVVCDDGGQPNVDRNVIANNREDGILSRGASSPQVQNNNILRNGGYAVKDGGRLRDNFIQGNNGLPSNAVETGLSPQGGQLFGVEEVISARSSPNAEAGERRFR